jgi:hypothetical protein
LRAACIAYVATSRKREKRSEVTPLWVLLRIVILQNEDRLYLFEKIY